MLTTFFNIKDQKIQMGIFLFLFKIYIIGNISTNKTMPNVINNVLNI